MDTYIPNSLKTFPNINWNEEHGICNTTDCNWLAHNISDHSSGLDTAYWMLCFWTECITFPKDLGECTLMQKASVKKNFQEGRHTVQRASGEAVGCSWDAASGISPRRLWYPSVKGAWNLGGRGMIVWGGERKRLLRWGIGWSCLSFQT